jgi:hypothetical protein
MRTLYALLLVVVATQIGVAQKMSQKQWIEDLTFIQEELPKHHVNLFHSISKTDYNNQFKILKAKVGSLNPEVILWEINKIIASIQDSYTMLQFSIKKNLPLGIQWFKDGYYITAINRQNEAFMAGKILSINSIPVKEIEAKIAKVLYAPNEASKKLLVANIIKNVSLLSYIEVAKGNSVELHIKKTDNKTEKLTVSFNPSQRGRGQMAFAIPEEIPLYKQNSRAWFWNSTLNDETLYLKYNVSNSREALLKTSQLTNASQRQIESIPSFNGFIKAVINKLNKNNFKKIVFDLRGNNGGEAQQGTNLLKAIQDTPFMQNGGKVITLIDASVYASAVNNTLESKQLLNATIIGEATSGSPNHFGNVDVLELPNSKLRLQYSTKYYQLSKKDENTITPDVMVPTSIQDFVTGKDPVLEKALSL